MTWAVGVVNENKVIWDAHFGCGMIVAEVLVVVTIVIDIVVAVFEVAVVVCSSARGCDVQKCSGMRWRLIESASTVSMRETVWSWVYATPTVDFESVHLVLTVFMVLKLVLMLKKIMM